MLYRGVSYSMTLSRKERRRNLREQRAAAGFPAAPPAPPALVTIRPMTINQSRVFKEFSRGQHLVLHGYAGTGKSFLSLYLALHEVMDKKTYKRVIIVRSAVPSRTQGFLPGTEEEKAAVYEAAYTAIVDDLFGKGGTYRKLKDQKVIEFTTTSYLRGLTIDDAIVIIDEVQNMIDGEINTVMTRVGQNTRVIICGDFRQNDLANKREESCIRSLMDTVWRMASFSIVEMTHDDIVRSGLVKEWILARE